MPISTILAEGNPRTLGRSHEVIELVLHNRSALKELYGCIFSSDEIVRMRASDALEKVCRQRPNWFLGYIDKIFNEMVPINQPSVQWHAVQILGEVQLNSAQKTRFIQLIKKYIEHDSDWIVLNNSMIEYAKLARQDPRLIPYFIIELRRLEKSRLRSVAYRASKLLKEFDH